MKPVERLAGMEEMDAESAAGRRYFGVPGAPQLAAVADRAAHHAGSRRAVRKWPAFSR